MKDSYLVVVESPTKARTIKRILGNPYRVFSCMGHIVDLPENRLGVKIKDGFIPQYRVIKGKEKIVKDLKEESKKVKKIFLATDPDREGEAISWHIKRLLEKKKISKEFLRVVFHEVTKEAIEKAFSSPSDLDMNKVNAQQARRILDRIVGYFLSPFLWRKVSRGLSAGRVQSVALKFIVDREQKIQEFVPEKYYHIDVYFEKEGILFKARLIKKGSQKITIKDKKEAQAIKKSLLDKDFLVKKIKVKTTLRKPYPPFITSSLQQEAFRNLRFSSAKTMLIAQRLYEGVELFEGPVGLITYMRTDSFYVAPQAKEEVKKFILERFSSKYLSEKEYKFKTKGIIQEAHEAIRPTSIEREPDKVSSFLRKDEAFLYELIWKRFVASFMREAEIENRHIEITCGDLEFISTGTKVLFDGFLRIYPEKIKEEALPYLEEGELLRAVKIEIEETTTKPPPRFNDASLVKLLEEKGIGRPSTYAPTISTLLARNYIRREKTGFIPTELGRLVIELLVKFFPQILDENFTAKMEEQLDYVEKGEKAWQKILEEFYPSFKEDVDRAYQLAKKNLIPAGRICDKCGREMVIRYSRKGKFISCSGYPECKNAYPLTTGIKCPQEGCSGELIERRNKKGKVFYGCSNYPYCKYTTSRLPQK
ncbi:type I DNA topoisomerase [Candidatus Woesearchaeota archaeon]|nr:MAG: type I DNA topoisomerase [Candidatus Woesearchaeota archaeon]